MVVVAVVMGRFTSARWGQGWGKERLIGAVIMIAFDLICLNWVMENIPINKADIFGCVNHTDNKVVMVGGGGGAVAIAGIVVNGHCDW